MIFTKSPVDIKSLLPDKWDKLTVADFMVGCASAGAHILGQPDASKLPSNPVVSPTISYNRTNGVLTFANASNWTSSPWSQYVYADTIGAFAVYKGTVGGK